MNKENDLLGFDQTEKPETSSAGTVNQENVPQTESGDTPNNESGKEEKEQQKSTPSDEITVHAPNGKYPIVLLFGASSSGKTMTLVRLAKYLRDKESCSVSVDSNFCNDVWEYNENAKKFNSMLATTTALEGTGRNDFLLIKIADRFGKVICYILEGAGEDYFPSRKGYDKSQIPFPPYMTGIFNGNNKKIWIFLTEPKWETSYEDKAEYVRRIQFCKRQYMSSKDKAIILYNKIDKSDYVYGAGKVHKENAIQGCNNEYPGLFQTFKNESLWPFKEPYTCKFVPFSTGIFGDIIPGKPQHYDASNDAYPETLWETIKKCIKG